jgi:hypothetical protein
MTIKNRYLLPQVDNMQEQLRKAVIFIQLDIKNIYYLIRITKGKEWKTVFYMRYGYYEY